MLPDPQLLGPGISGASVCVTVLRLDWQNFVDRFCFESKAASFAGPVTQSSAIHQELTPPYPWE